MQTTPIYDIAYPDTGDPSSLQTLMSAQAQSAEDALVGIGGSLTPIDTGWVGIPIASGYAHRPGTWQQFAAMRRRAGIVYIQLHMDFTVGNYSGSANLATLPPGFRPEVEIRWMGFRTGRSSTPVGGWVLPSGIITFQPDSTNPIPAGTHFSCIIPPFIAQEN